MVLETEAAHAAASAFLRPTPSTSWSVRVGPVKVPLATAPHNFDRWSSKAQELSHHATEVERRLGLPRIPGLPLRTNLRPGLVMRDFVEVRIQRLPTPPPGRAGDLNVSETASAVAELALTIFQRQPLN